MGTRRVLSLDSSRVDGGAYSASNWRVHFERVSMLPDGRPRARATSCRRRAFDELVYNGALVGGGFHSRTLSTTALPFQRSGAGTH